MKKVRIILAIAMAVGGALAGSLKPVCRRPLITAFGLTGNDGPAPTRLGMCHQIKNSCCSTYDQLVLFENWEFSHEHSNLLQRLDYQKDVYGFALATATHVSHLANNTLHFFSTETVSDCKVLAKQITRYRIEEITPKLTEALLHLQTYMESVYSGVYCAICDADAHPFFNLKDQQITYGVRFCRNLVMKALPVLLYLSNHMTKYMNLIIQFTSGCDKNGVFTDNAHCEADLFVQDLVLRKRLEKCRDARNTEEWYEKCHFICDEFNLVDFPKILEPFLKKYAETNLLIRQNLYKYEHLTDETLLQSNHSRVLEARKDVQTQQTRSFDDPEADAAGAIPEYWLLRVPEVTNTTEIRGVINSAQNSDLSIDQFEGLWAEEGLQLDEYGAETEISHAKYEKLYAEKIAAQNGFVGLFGRSLGVIFGVWVAILAV